MVAKAQKEFVVSIENRPGTLADIANALGKANVNILGFELQAQGDFGQFRFTTDEVAKAETTLKNSHVHYRGTEIVTVTAPNNPGELGRLAARIANSGVNIEAAYPIFGNDAPQIAFRVDDVPSAVKALQ